MEHIWICTVYYSKRNKFQGWYSQLYNCNFCYNDILSVYSFSLKGNKIRTVFSVPVMLYVIKYSVDFDSRCQYPYSHTYQTIIFAYRKKRRSCWYIKQMTRPYNTNQSEGKIDIWLALNKQWPYEIYYGRNTERRTHTDIQNRWSMLIQSSLNTYHIISAPPNIKRMIKKPKLLKTL